jgi:hypothetical protein
MSTHEEVMESLQKTNLDARNYLIRLHAKRVIEALRKHSFSLSDKELWPAANDLQDSLEKYEEYIGSGFVR